MSYRMFKIILFCSFVCSYRVQVCICTYNMRFLLHPSYCERSIAITALSDNESSVKQTQGEMGQTLLQRTHPSPLILLRVSLPISDRFGSDAKLLVSGSLCVSIFFCCVRVC